MLTITRIAPLALAGLLVAAATPLRAEVPEPALSVREFQLEHVDVKEANAIVRSLLNVRKSAIDVRRQVVILADTKETLDQAAEILARVDRAHTEWTISLVARSRGERVVLRTVKLSDGRLQVQFGPPPATTSDNLGITATAQRAASGEIAIEWAASVALAGVWTESAQAVEALHDGDVVMLLATTEVGRRKALASLLGIAGEVDSLELHVEQRARAAAPTRR